VAASQVLRLAAFKSRLPRFVTEADPWSPDWICYYFINDSAAPSFVVDVSDYYEQKRLALECHSTQFTAPAANASVAATRLNTPLFMQLIDSRDAQFGALAGVTRAEGFVVREPIVRSSLMKRLP